MAVIVYLLLHISAQALHYLRLILALLFLPRLPLRHFPSSFGQSSTTEAAFVPSSHRNPFAKRLTEVATLQLTKDNPQHGNLIPPTMNIPHAQQEIRRLLLSEQHGINGDFSIYASALSLKPNRPNLIATMSPNHLSGALDDLSALRAASERVSEILRESRRRLDEGEDTSVIRREARRKRTQELLSTRKQGAHINPTRYA